MPMIAITEEGNENENEMEHSWKMKVYHLLPVVEGLWRVGVEGRFVKIEWPINFLLCQQRLTLPLKAKKQNQVTNTCNT